MLSSKDVTLVYETLLASPGMNDVVKLNFRLSRKQVLLLSQVIEAGMKAGNEHGTIPMVGNADAEALNALTIVAEDLLKKADLTAVKTRINELMTK